MGGRRKTFFSSRSGGNDHVYTTFGLRTLSYGVHGLAFGWVYTWDVQKAFVEASFLLQTILYRRYIKRIHLNE